MSFPTFLGREVFTIHLAHLCPVGQDCVRRTFALQEDLGMGKRSQRRTCTSCRSRHLRCDGNIPDCDNCSKSGRKCALAPWYLFRTVAGTGDETSEQPIDLNACVHANNQSLDQDATLRTTTQHTGVIKKHQTIHFIDQTLEVSEAYRLQDQRGPATPFDSGPALSHQALGPHKDVDVSDVDATPQEEHLIQIPQQDPLSNYQGLQKSPPASLSTLSIQPLEYVEAFNGFSFSPLLLDGLDPVRWTVNDLFSSSNHEQDLLAQSRDALAPAPASVVSSTPNFSTREAQLLKTFINEWGPLLDCNDSERHFSTVIPRLALTRSKCLLYAIFTIAALYLSRVKDYPPSDVQFYRKQCAHALLPALQEDASSVHEEDIFATYVLLRVYDHLNVNFSEKKPNILFTEGLALSTTPWNAYHQEADLKQAAFWVHLRQDIHVALLLECPIDVDHTLYAQTVAVATGLTEQDLQQRAPQQQSILGVTDVHSSKFECAWANKMVGIALNAVNYCYADTAKSIDEWGSILVTLERWNIEKPDNFRPFLEVAADTDKSGVFPEIYLATDWHIIGLMYFHLSMIMLKSNRPGQSARTYDSLPYDLRQEISCHIQILCGIVQSNPITQGLLISTAMFNAVGPFIKGSPARQQVIELLQLARKMTGVPVDDIVNNLQNTWAEQVSL